MLRLFGVIILISYISSSDILPFLMVRFWQSSSAKGVALTKTTKNSSVRSGKARIARFSANRSSLVLVKVTVHNSRFFNLAVIGTGEKKVD